VTPALIPVDAAEPKPLAIAVGDIRLVAAKELRQLTRRH
jgi:hypothetical protein